MFGDNHEGSSHTCAGIVFRRASSASCLRLSNSTAPDATQTFLVSYTDDAGYEHDVTSECVTSNLARASMKRVTVKCRGLQASAPVVVKASARPPGVSFVNDVSPIFTMSGCAGANCHGSIRGQRGFKLSLFGNDPKLDYEAIMGGDHKRVNLKEPAKSLLLTKPTTETPHGGGFRFAPGFAAIPDAARLGPARRLLRYERQRSNHGAERLSRGAGPARRR